jgi:hypothetical protein
MMKKVIAYLGVLFCSDTLKREILLKCNLFFNGKLGSLGKE